MVTDVAVGDGVEITGGKVPIQVNDKRSLNYHDIYGHTFDFLFIFHVYLSQ